MLMLLNFLTFNNFILLSLSVKGAKMIVYTVYIVTIRGSRLLENENKKPEKLKKAKSSLSWNYDEKYLFTFIVLPYNRENNSDVVLNSQINFLKLYSSFTK